MGTLSLTRDELVVLGQVAKVPLLRPDNAFLGYALTEGLRCDVSSLTLRGKAVFNTLPIQYEVSLQETEANIEFTL